MKKLKKIEMKKEMKKKNMIGRREDLIVRMITIGTE